MKRRCKAVMLTGRRLRALDARELGSEAVGETGDLSTAADGCDGEARRQLRLRRRLPANTQAQPRLCL